jgi:hypothetical protein
MQIRTGARALLAQVGGVAARASRLSSNSYHAFRVPSYAHTPLGGIRHIRATTGKPAKENFGNMYHENTPQAYITRLNPIDYGHYHDRFTEMITAEFKAFAPKGRQMIAVELGTSYGNTTLAYKCGYNWEAVSKAWLDEQQPLAKTFDIYVNAVDISTESLAFGKRRGIFNETFQQDFAQPYSPAIAAKLQEADFVTSIMTSFYIPTERWMEGCYKFLSDRSKPKLLVYNVMQAFDQRNLSPELLFAGIPNWTSKSAFSKHRNFTQVEQAR